MKEDNEEDNEEEEEEEEEKKIQYEERAVIIPSSCLRVLRDGTARADSWRRVRIEMAAAERRRERRSRAAQLSFQTHAPFVRRTLDSP